MHDDVQRLAEHSGELRVVAALAAPDGRFTTVRFVFEAGALEFDCDDDTDEVLALVADGRGALPEVTSGVLSELGGLVIEYAWELRNHRGYLDGFQLRLRNGTGREETVQLEVAASAIDVRRVA